MTELNFPDQPLRQGSPIPPATIENVAYLLERAGITCRYNQVQKRVEINIPSYVGTSDNLDDSTLSTVVSLCSQHGMAIGQIGHYVNAIADRDAYNPVADWIDSQPWDGIDRMPEVYATVVQQADYPVALKEVLMRKWFRSAVAAAKVARYKGRGVLTFQGPQGIGKTSWVSALVDDPVLREKVVALDHHMEPTNKDSLVGAISNWIVEFGEVDSAFKRDIARLKGFITRDSDRVRRPYARRESIYDRRTLFVATVNETSFLVDPTGNSRWWTVAVDKLDYHHAINMQQVFAQMAVEVEQGEIWWLSPDEEEQLAEWNNRHVAASVVADAIHACIDLDGNKFVAMTPTELLKAAGIDRPTNPQAKECGAILRQLFGPPKLNRGRDKWRVPFREPTAADLMDEAPAVTSKRSPSVAPGEIF